MKTFAVDAAIQATPDRLWRILTDLAAYPRWNPTITSVSLRRYFCVCSMRVPGPDTPALRAEVRPRGMDMVQDRFGVSGGRRPLPRSAIG